MKFFLALLFHAIIFIFPQQIRAAQESSAVIESIAFIGERNSAEIVYFYLSNEIQPKIFELAGEKPRIVLDFPNVDYLEKKQTVISTNGKYIQRIRVGLHHQPIAKTRVVFDLAGSDTYSIKQRYLALQNILEVTISPSSAKVKTEEPAAVVQQPKNLQGQDADNVSNQQKPLENKMGSKASVKEFETIVSNTPTPQAEDSAASQGEVEDITEKPSDQIFSETEAVVSDGTSVEEPHILQDLTFERTMGNKEMILFKLNGFYPPVVFAIDNENLRVVCDFLDAQLSPGIQETMETEGKYIKRVRVARHTSPEKVRVVLDLAAQEDYDLKQIFFKEDNLFVLILSIVDEK